MSKPKLLEKTELDGFNVTPLGIGTSRLGAFWQKRSPDDGLKALNMALDYGVNLIDTADVYARGLSERLVGRAIQDHPEAVVMTKVGLLKTPRGLVNAARFGGNVGLSGLKAAQGADTCFSARYVEAAAMQCMKRQGRDDLDILLLHEPQADSFKQPELIDKVLDLKEAGKIGAWGASVRDIPSALAALDAEGISWLQVPVNIADTSVLDAVNLHPNRSKVVVVGLAVLGDGALMSKTVGMGMSSQRAVSALVEGTYKLDGVDAVLLGMNRSTHVRENISALYRGAEEKDIQKIKALI